MTPVLEPGEFARMVAEDEKGILKAAGFFPPHDTLPPSDRKPTPAPGAPSTGESKSWFEHPMGPAAARTGAEPSSSSDAGWRGMLAPIIDWLRNKLPQGQGRHDLGGDAPIGGLGNSLGGQGSWSLGGTGYGGGVGPGGFFSRRTANSQGWSADQIRGEGNSSLSPVWQPKETSGDAATGLLDRFQGWLAGNGPARSEPEVPGTESLLPGTPAGGSAGTPPATDTPSAVPTPGAGAGEALAEIKIPRPTKSLPLLGDVPIPVNLLPDPNETLDKYRSLSGGPKALPDDVKQQVLAKAPQFAPLLELDDWSKVPRAAWAD